MVRAHVGGSGAFTGLSLEQNTNMSMPVKAHKALTPENRRIPNRRSIKPPYEKNGENEKYGKKLIVICRLKIKVQREIL
jgi:hypothetical protein